jgi:hypothetical protein
MLLWERTATPAREEQMLNLSKVVQQLKTEREQTRAKLNRLETALKILLDMGTAGPRSQSRGDVHKAEKRVGRRPEENCRRPACTMGQMESGSKEKNEIAFPAALTPSIPSSSRSLVFIE